jgi:hypothetical protein
MRAWARLAIVALCCQAGLASLGVSPANAQAPNSPNSYSTDSHLAIKNPNHRVLPVEKVRVLFVVTCNVVAQEFHRDPSETEFNLTLVLGEKNEHYTIDPQGSLILYLDQWDETKFVDGAITGAVQRLTAPQIRKRMSSEILRRSDNIAPVSVKGFHAPTTAPPVRLNTRDCISAVNDKPCDWTKQPPH